MTKKKPEPNPIEEAIGDRAKTPETPSPQNPGELPDELSSVETLNLEELNRRTEERLRDEEPPQETVLRPTENYQKIPVSKPNLLPVTKISSQESPPQKIVDPITAWQCPDCGVLVRDKTLQGLPCQQHRLEHVVEANRKQNEITESTLPKLPSSAMKNSDGLPREYTQEEAEEAQEAIEHEHLRRMKKACAPPAEDIELTNLRKYILEDGFPVSAVAFHIVTLCSQPLVVTSTTTWDFRDRANIPEMVFALLHQPGYIEGVWPSLKIIMGSNAGNPAWSAGVLMTIALFDVVRTLPALKELKELENAS